MTRTSETPGSTSTQVEEVEQARGDRIVCKQQDGSNQFVKNFSLCGDRQSLGRTKEQPLPKTIPQNQEFHSAEQGIALTAEEEDAKDGANQVVRRRQLRGPAVRLRQRVWRNSCSGSTQTSFSNVFVVFCQRKLLEIDWKQLLVEIDIYVVKNAARCL